MSEAIDQYLSFVGTPSDSKPVPQERFDAFDSIFPSLLLEAWEQVGFAGFKKGFFWLCDPVEWAPAVAAWTKDLNLKIGQDNWHAIGRNAFGQMELWGERTGLSLIIEPVHGLIVPSQDAASRMGTEQLRNNQIVALLYTTPTAKGLFGQDERPLFDRAVKAHGEVGPDTLYSFVPAHALGGPLTVDHIEIADAPTHVELLADLSPRRVTGDITMSR